MASGASHLPCIRLVTESFVSACTCDITVNTTNHKTILFITKSKKYINVLLSRLISLLWFLQFDVILIFPRRFIKDYFVTSANPETQCHPWNPLKLSPSPIAHSQISFILGYALFITYRTGQDRYACIAIWCQHVVYIDNDGRWVDFIPCTAGAISRWWRT